MGELEQLLEENEYLRKALLNFGTYPDAWDDLPEKTRLEVRIEKPASRWAVSRVIWRVGELQAAKAALIRQNNEDRARQSARRALTGGEG